MNHLNWPELRYEDWKDCCQTLHRWIQIVGKIRLSKTPWLNHSWNSTLYVTERGLSTSVIHERDVSFAIDFDFLSHALVIMRSDGESARLPLSSEPVSAFYAKCVAALSDLRIDASIVAVPNELPDAIPFAEDELHRTYSREYAERFWRVLLQCDRVMGDFRSRFEGKSSPVHLFWGSVDLAVTRFSGRLAPEHPGGIPHLPDLVTREAYSHEVSSCGFWPGSEAFPRAAFYSYAYPTPDGFEKAKTVEGAFFEPKLREFVLPYDVVREAASPDALLLDFFQCAYDAAASLANWDRKTLEETPYMNELKAQSEKRRSRREAA